MSYRVEAAKTGRAGCSATHCKKEGAKIEKGSLRQGVLVTINEHTSWKWRHWGCVTPTVLFNWKDSTDGNMDLVDGYDELPADLQDKVKRALEQVHVDDEDWNGDVEMNRYNPAAKQQGMFVKTPKKSKKDDDDGESEASPTKKPAAKKRGRAKVDKDDDEAEPAPKKARGRKKKAVEVEEPEDPESEPEPVKAPKKAAKGKKAKAAAADDEVNEEPAPATKKGRAKKAAKSAETVVESDDDVPELEEAPAPKKGRAKKGTAKVVKAADKDVEEAPKPQKRGRKAAKD